MKGRMGKQQQLAGKKYAGEMPSTPGITVLIADDHELVRDGLICMLGKWTDVTVVAEAKTGIEAVEEWEKYRPNVTLMDLQMPQLDGISAIRQIRQRDCTARIIILTTFEGDEDIYYGISAGAKAYLLKDTPRDGILNCIRAVHAGQTFMPSSIAAKLAERISGTQLTEREITVLRILASGLSNKEIAAKLFISEVTVKAHLKNIFTKLNVVNRTEAIAAATRRGFFRLEK